MFHTYNFYILIFEEQLEVKGESELRLLAFKVCSFYIKERETLKQKQGRQKQRKRGKRRKKRREKE